jgi:hypothetical protein
MAISIKEPCNEDWSKMTPSEKGAHCQHCALDVIDFTNKTPFEIKGILSDEFSSGKRVCGRITNDQLDQLNDDFFQWKSEQEAFRAVWIFSLIAVFGLTLFSCQHASTREMIDQLNIEASTALSSKDSVQIEMTDSATTAKMKDSISPVIGIPWNPEIITYTGVLPYDWGHIDLTKWITCNVVFGDFILTGSVTTAPKEEVEKFLLAGPLLKPVMNRINSPATPKTLPQEEKFDSRLQAINSAGDKKFEAFIYPNPIDESSRLFLNVFESLSLDLYMFKQDETKPFRHGHAEVEFGKHQIDLKLYKLEPGEYQLKIRSNSQLSILDFTVGELGTV